jgi:hypothetical protein
VLIYFDNGKFKMIVFSKSGIIDELDINKELGMDDRARSLDNLQTPMAAATFTKPGLIFASVFHSRENKLYQFEYNILRKTVVKEHFFSFQLEHKKYNYPISSLYDSDRGLIMLVMKQGEVVIRRLGDTGDNVQLVKIQMQDTNDAMLYLNKVFYVDGSQQI